VVDARPVVETPKLVSLEVSEMAVGLLPKWWVGGGCEEDEGVALGSADSGWPNPGLAYDATSGPVGAFCLLR